MRCPVPPSTPPDMGGRLPVGAREAPPTRIFFALIACSRAETAQECTQTLALGQRFRVPGVRAGQDASLEKGAGAPLPSLRTYTSTRKECAGPGLKEGLTSADRPCGAPGRGFPGRG
jgi:hypothetical protein